MSILEDLENKYIVSFDLMDDNKSVEVMEMCDLWYKESLDKKEFKQLIDELTALYGQMI